MIMYLHFVLFLMIAHTAMSQEMWAGILKQRERKLFFMNTLQPWNVVCNPCLNVYK